MLEEADIARCCFICSGHPFPLKKDNSQRLIDHIAEKHMPLFCRKCNKVSCSSSLSLFWQTNGSLTVLSLLPPMQVYSSRDDFSEISKCSGFKMCENMDDKKPVVAITEADEEDKENTRSEQESKTKSWNLDKLIAEGVDEKMLTPMTKINLKWRRKSAGLYPISSDTSAMTVKTTKVIDTSITLRRTTSTPMAQTNQSHEKAHNLESLCSSYQPSSIEHSGASSNTHSPLGHPIVSPSPVAPVVQVPIHTTQKIKRYRLPVSQTPLRQLLSKSIQRQLHERGFYLRAQRKIPFHSMNSSDSSNGSSNQVSPTEPSPPAMPLDLRTTPVLRRTQSDSSPNRRAMLQQREVLYDEEQLEEEDEASSGAVVNQSEDGNMTEDR